MPHIVAQEVAAEPVAQEKTPPVQSAAMVAPVTLGLSLEIPTPAAAAALLGQAEDPVPADPILAVMAEMAIFLQAQQGWMELVVVAVVVDMRETAEPVDQA
jgi:hypothetical protein